MITFKNEELKNHIKEILDFFDDNYIDLDFYDYDDIDNPEVDDNITIDLNTTIELCLPECDDAYTLTLEELKSLYSELRAATILDITYIQKISSQYGFEYNETKEGLPQLIKKGISHTFHARFINDILINFFEVKVAIETMIKFFEQLEKQGDGLSSEEQKQMESRPKDKEEFIKYLENNYVIVELNKNGELVKVNTMGGKRIPL